MFSLDKVEIRSFLSRSTNEGETNLSEFWGGWEVGEGPEWCAQCVTWSPAVISVNSHTGHPSHSSVDTIQQWLYWQNSELPVMSLALPWPCKWAVTNDLKKWMPQAHIQVRGSFFIPLIFLQSSCISYMATSLLENGGDMNFQIWSMTYRKSG